MALSCKAGCSPAAADLAKASSADIAASLCGGFVAFCSVMRQQPPCIIEFSQHLRLLQAPCLQTALVGMAATVDAGDAASALWPAIIGTIGGAQAGQFVGADLVD